MCLFVGDMSRYCRCTCLVVLTLVPGVQLRHGLYFDSRPGCVMVYIHINIYMFFYVYICTYMCLCMCECECEGECVCVCVSTRLCMFVRARWISSELRCPAPSGCSRECAQYLRLSISLAPRLNACIRVCVFPNVYRPNGPFSLKANRGRFD